MANRRQFPSDHRPWFRVLGEIIHDEKISALSAVDFALFIKVLASLCLAHSRDGTVFLSWRAICSLSGCNKRVIAQRSLDHLRVIGVLCADHSAIGSRLTVSNWAKLQGFAPALRVEQSRVEQSRVEDIESAPVNAPKKRAARRRVGGGAKLPEQPDLVLVNPTPKEPPARPFDPREKCAAAHLAAIPSDFPKTWEVEWYQRLWATARAALVYHHPDLRVEYFDGSVDDFPSWLTVVGWLHAKWPAICSNVEERRQSSKSGRASHKSTAGAWWGRLVTGISGGDERSERELIAGAMRGIELFEADFVRDAMASEERARVASAAKEGRQ